MRRITRQEQCAELHRFEHETAHRDDALLKDFALLERPAIVRFEPCGQLGPNAFVRPVVGRVLWVALKVQPLHVARSRAHQRETALVMRVDEFRRVQRSFHQNAEPAERIRSRELMTRSRGNRRSAYAMVAVATGDEVAVELATPVVVLKTHERLRRIEIRRRDIPHVEQ